MNRLEALAWARGHHGLGHLAPRIARQLKTLSSASEGGPFLIDYYEATLNSRDMARRVKLVHFARAAEQAGRAARKAWGLKRRRALESLLRGGGLDARPLKSMYDAVLGAGIDGFYPVASVEWDVPAGRFEEVSLYCDQEAPAAAEAIGRGLGVPERELAPALDLPRLFAVGYDFRPGLPSRFKLYHRWPLSRRALARYASGRPFLALPARSLPAEFLVLRRRPDGGRFEDTRKVYLCYLTPSGSPIDCRVSALAEACAPGPLKRFLTRLARSAEGQYVDYIGCEDGRFEAYFGKPSWGGYVERLMGKPLPWALA